MLHKLSICSFLLLIGLLILSPSLSHGETGKIWRAKAVLSEKPGRGHVNTLRWCNGSRFKPCVCHATIPDLLKYRPAVAECGGRAAVFLFGKWMHAYSVVVRDQENRDRWPALGFNGCTQYESETLGLNRCSAFKAQKRFRVANGRKEADVFCMGASGYSPYFRNAVRITVKLADIPNSTNDPIMRFCLKGPAEKIN